MKKAKEKNDPVYEGKMKDRCGVQHEFMHAFINKSLHDLTEFQNEVAASLGFPSFASLLPGGDKEGETDILKKHADFFKLTFEDVITNANKEDVASTTLSDMVFDDASRREEEQE